MPVVCARTGSRSHREAASRAWVYLRSAVAAFLHAATSLYLPKAIWSIVLSAARSSVLAV